MLKYFDIIRIMGQLFKQEEKKPFTYSSIEMRKSTSKFNWYVISVVLLIIVLGIVYLMK